MLLQCLILCICLPAAFSTAAKRKLDAQVDPYCDGNPSDCGLCYVRAVGTNDTLHHFWSTRGAPTLFTVITGPEGLLSGINWDQIRKREFKSSAFHFTETSRLAYALVLSKIWESSKDANVSALDLTKLVWGNVTGCSGNGSLVSAGFTASRTSMEYDHLYFSQNGSIHLTMVASEKWNHEERPPGLARDGNSCEVQLQLVKLDPRLTNDSHWNVEVTFVGSWEKTHPPQFVVESTLDDQHAPGTFERDTLKSEEQYTMWRPVFYSDRDHKMTLSGIAKRGDVVLSSDAWRLSDTFYAWVANSKAPEAASLPMYLGSTKTSYTSWSTTVGIGAVPSEGPPSVALLAALCVAAIFLILAVVTLLCMLLPKKAGPRDDEALLVA
ncbi:glycosylated lysosomal membrane protein-like [Ornithodoros turicata]|uniref:glycosylated lysosomal membrane protein-like n=1 Tax=Ornithodoros turicata TaxID=34597 RepID=UPI003139E2C7